MPNLSLIEFRRSDYSVPPYIEQYALEIAAHFKVRRTYFNDFCLLFRRSRNWKISNLDVCLNEWRERFSKLNGTRTIVDIICRAFTACQDDQDISFLRGVMLEALVIARQGGPDILDNLSKNVGWGAKVFINGSKDEIYYRCTGERLYPDCGGILAAIDFGEWDGNHGVFCTCKVQSIKIGCLDIQYLRVIAKELRKLGGSFDLYLVSPESEDNMLERFEFLTRAIEGEHIKIMGREKLSA